MARIENTKMTVSLDNDSKRLIRTLTKAIDRLAKTQEPSRGYEGVRRLSEPVMDVAEGGYDQGEEVSDEDELKHKRPAMFSGGGYVAGEISEEELEKMRNHRPEMYPQDPLSVTNKYTALG